MTGITVNGVNLMDLQRLRRKTTKKTTVNTDRKKQNNKKKDKLGLSWAKLSSSWD